MTSFAFTIPGRMDGMNEILQMHHLARGRYKRREMARVIACMEQAGKPASMFRRPVRVTYTAYECDHRRDWDNIFGVIHKIVLDALQEAEIIKRDSQKYVLPPVDIGRIDPIRPRIEVRVEEVDEVDEADEILKAT